MMQFLWWIFLCTPFGWMYILWMLLWGAKEYASLYDFDKDFADSER